MDNDFLKSVLERILELKSLKTKTIFSISTTAKQEHSSYLTPIRFCKDFAITGCIIFDQTNLSILLEKLDGNVDIILSDSEKKISFNWAELNYDLVKNYNQLEEITISNICFQTITKSQIYEFKPNDLTVNAAWSFLSQKLKSLNGKKICILGSGNIGSKLALKLVECGSEVYIYRRNIDKANIIISGLNLIKPKNIESKIHFCSDVMLASSNADVLIGASNGVSIIDENIVKSLRRDCLIIDLGKNNLSQKAIKIAMEYSINIYRTDVTPGLESFVYELLKTQDILKYSSGKKNLGFCKIVSGGYFGGYGDIVVDNIENPSRVLGVAQGNGSFKQVLNKTDKDNIKKLKKSISNKY